MASPTKAMIPRTLEDHVALLIELVNIASGMMCDAVGSYDCKHIEEDELDAWLKNMNRYNYGSALQHVHSVHAMVLESPQKTSSNMILVGTILYGYCGGHFGRDSYDDKRVEGVGVGVDWVIVREIGSGRVYCATGEDVHKDLLEYTTPETDR